MKAIFVLFLVIVGLGIWFYVDPDARRQWLAATPLVPSPEVTTVYKWRDDEGNWQITDTPPPAGIDFETLTYHRDTNVMPLVPKDKLKSSQD